MSDQKDPFEGVPEQIKELFKRPPFKTIIDQACEDFLTQEVCDKLDEAFQNDDPNVEVELPYLGGMKVKAKDAKQLYKHYRNQVTAFLMSTMKTFVMSVEASTMINVALLMKEAGMEVPPHIEKLLDNLPPPINMPQQPSPEPKAKQKGKTTWDKTSRWKARGNPDEN